jgi:hypothetical protein
LDTQEINPLRLRNSYSSSNDATTTMVAMETIRLDFLYRGVESSALQCVLSLVLTHRHTRAKQVAVAIDVVHAAHGCPVFAVVFGIERR